MTTEQIVAALAEPFQEHELEWRQQRGFVYQDRKTNQWCGGAEILTYIDSRAVMNRLDKVVGPANWRDGFQSLTLAEGKVVITCTLELKIDGEWIGKTDGAGQSDIEAEKGSLSGAMKRAAVKWGIGRYLYGLKRVTYFGEQIRDGRAPKDTQAIDVVCKPARNAPKDAPTIRGHVFPPKLPDWALPSQKEPPVDTEGMSDLAKKLVDRITANRAGKRVAAYIANTIKAINGKHGTTYKTLRDFSDEHLQQWFDSLADTGGG